MFGDMMTGEFIAGGLAFTGMDLLSAAFTLAYVGRLLFEGVLSYSHSGGSFCLGAAKQSLQSQHVFRRARS